MQRASPITRPTELSSASAPGVVSEHVLRFDLQAAYRFSENVTDQDVETLFWSVDRFTHDRAQTSCADRERQIAIQRIATELDRRGVPVRDPSVPSSYPSRSDAVVS